MGVLLSWGWGECVMSENWTHSLLPGLWVSRPVWAGLVWMFNVLVLMGTS